MYFVYNDKYNNNKNDFQLNLDSDIEFAHIYFPPNWHIAIVSIKVHQKCRHFE